LSRGKSEEIGDQTEESFSGLLKMQGIFLGECFAFATRMKGRDEAIKGDCGRFRLWIFVIVLIDSSLRDWGIAGGHAPPLRFDLDDKIRDQVIRRDCLGGWSLIPNPEGGQGGLENVAIEDGDGHVGHAKANRTGREGKLCQTKVIRRYGGKGLGRAIGELDSNGDTPTDNGSTVLVCDHDIQSLEFSRKNYGMASKSFYVEFADASAIHVVTHRLQANGIFANEVEIFFPEGGEGDLGPLGMAGFPDHASIFKMLDQIAPAVFQTRDGDTKAGLAAIDEIKIKEGKTNRKIPIQGLTAVGGERIQLDRFRRLVENLTQWGDNDLKSVRVLRVEFKADVLEILNGETSEFVQEFIGDGKAENKISTFISGVKIIKLPHEPMPGIGKEAVGLNLRAGRPSSRQESEKDKYDNGGYSYDTPHSDFHYRVEASGVSIRKKA
jgi:hypothetical protein